MKCMHCLTSFHATPEEKYIGVDEDKTWALIALLCPACNRYNMFLANYENWHFQKKAGVNMINSYPIRPKGASRPPCPIEVPAKIAADYNEACLVLLDSPKASAALSRRCLQNILRETAGVKHSDLSKEIQEVLDGGKLPTYLANTIDAVRNTGNFAAHPLKSQATGEIIEVEPGEAEWNLDVLEALFDFYYVQPDNIAKKRAALDTKLATAGKPPMK